MFATLVVGQNIGAWRVDIDQPVAAEDESILGGFRCGTMDALFDEPFPVIWLDPGKFSNYIRLFIGGHAPVAIPAAEKATGKILERFLAARFAPDDLVGLEPDQQSLIIIIFGPLPARPRLGSPGSDDRIMGRVNQRTPAAPDSLVDAGGNGRKCIERILF